MTVAQLIEQLHQFDPAAEIYVATDCHGCYVPANKVSRNDKDGNIVIEENWSIGS